MHDLARLESIAQQLIARVRDDDPEANLRWLRAMLGSNLDAPMTDTERMIFVLAAVVPDYRTWRQLTAWTEHDHAALVRELTIERYRPAGRRAA